MSRQGNRSVGRRGKRREREREERKETKSGPRLIEIVSLIPSSRKIGLICVFVCLCDLMCVCVSSRRASRSERRRTRRPSKGNPKIQACLLPRVGWADKPDTTGGGASCSIVVGEAPGLLCACRMRAVGSSRRIVLDVSRLRGWKGVWTGRC